MIVGHTPPDPSISQLDMYIFSMLNRWSIVLQTSNFTVQQIKGNVVFLFPYT